MKKIVLLGSGNEEINAIKIANNLGYYVISLDSNPAAPGAKFSDSFFQCDISSAKSVYEIVKNLKIDGIMVHAIELSNVVAEVSDQISVGKNRNEAMQRAERARDLINVKTI